MSEYTSAKELKTGLLAILQRGRQITTFKSTVPHSVFDNATDIVPSHLGAYSNPNFTTWAQAGYTFPTNSLYNNGC